VQRRCSSGFEAEFNNGLKHVCHLLGVGNRQEKVPSIAAVTVIDGTKFNLVLQPGGKARFQDKKEEQILDSGKKVTHWILSSETSVKKTVERLARRSTV
jgi:hypothetical protein